MTNSDDGLSNVNPEDIVPGYAADSDALDPDSDALDDELMSRRRQQSKSPGKGQRAAGGAAPAVPLAHAPVVEALEAVELAHQASRDAEIDLAIAVQRARALRATWLEIGRVLNISAQAAHKRFRYR